MHALLQTSYFWRYSYKSVLDHVQNCPICSVAPSTSVKHVGMEEIEQISPAVVWSHIELHFVGPLKSSKRDHQFLLIAFDPASRWVAASPIRDKQLEATAFLIETMCNYGLTACSLFDIDVDEYVHFKEQ